MRNVFSLLSQDVRVRDYPLMQEPIKMTSILIAYVIFSKCIGPRIMANRKPFHLNMAMIVYNLSMVLLNAFVVYEVNKIIDKQGFFLPKIPISSHARMLVTAADVCLTSTVPRCWLGHHLHVEM